MARNREAGNAPEDKSSGAGVVDNSKGSRDKIPQQKDNSVEVFKAGLEVTPESLGHDQRRKANESEMAADKAEIEKLKVKEELKKAREAAGVKDEKEIIAEKLNITPDKVEEVVDKKIEDTANSLVEEAPAVVEQLQNSGAVTPEQAQQVQVALQSPQARGRISNFFHRMKDSATWGTISGVLAGAAVKGGAKLLALGALGTSLPVFLAAGATAGASVEGVKAMWRESKKLNYKENIDRLENEPDQFRKAALLNKLEEAYKEQRINGSPEDLKMAGEALSRARLHLEAHLHSKDVRFENESDRDKLMFLLRTSEVTRGGIDRSTKRETKQLLKDMERELTGERKLANLKGRWGNVGRSALKGAVFGTLGASVGYAVTSTDLIPNAWNGLKDMLGFSTAEKAQAALETVLPGKEALSNHEFSQKIGAKGITGAYREMIRDYFIQQKTLDPNFAPGVGLEKLVHVEDHLKDLALEHGVPQGSGIIKATGAELQRAIEQAMQVDEKGVESIRVLIDGKKHFISEAVREHMLDWTPGTLSNPDNDVLSGIVMEVQSKIASEAGDNISSEIFSGDRYYQDVMTMLVTSALVEEGLDQAFKKAKKDQGYESGFRPLAQSEESLEVGPGVVSSVGETQPRSSGPVTKEGIVTATSEAGSEDGGQNNLQESSEFTLELKEQIKNELDKKLKDSGMDVIELGLVYNDDLSPDQQRVKANQLVDSLIASYKKNSSPKNLPKLIIELNYQKDKLSDVEHRSAKLGLAQDEGVFLRIPAHFKDDYYDKKFDEFFKEYSPNANEENDEGSDGNEEIVEQNEDSLEGEGGKQEWVQDRESLIRRHDHLDKVTVSKAIKRDRRIDPEETYAIIDRVLTGVKQEGKLDKKYYDNLKEIVLVKSEPRKEDRSENTLYLKVPIKYTTPKEQKDLEGMIVRVVRNMKAQESAQAKSEDPTSPKDTAPIEPPTFAETLSKYET